MRHAVLAGTLTLAIAGSASALPGRIPTFEKVALAGRTLRVASLSALDQACQSLGPLAISLIDVPHAGRVTVEHGRDYPNFSALNTRSRCNTRKVPSTVILYTPASGYTGSDEFAIEIVGPHGNVGRARYEISVR